MAKNLVIVESPAKAKTINKILGADFVVRASLGHVRDLPEKELGVDVEKGFKPKYVDIASRAKVLKELRAEAEHAETIYLAPDPDREGEAIAWHLQAAISRAAKNAKFLRVTYNEITAPAIRRAFAEPRAVDQHKVDSQQARRVLDRLVGYQVSPLLWRRIRGAMSAGRVQSVAVRLVCEREREIQKFQPEEYWVIGLKVRKQVDPRDVFEVRLAKIDGEKIEVRSADRAHAIRADLEGRTPRVSAIIPREIAKRPPPSYITSTLQQAASRLFGFPPARTMKVAQKLYEGKDFGEGPVGLITYMRTDSVAVSPVAQAAAREYVQQHYGPEYLPPTPHVYKSRGSAQEAHEAIRPTDVNRTPDQLARFLDAEELRLYRIIWQRFLACQMASARIAQRTVEVEVPPPPGGPANYLFRASASEVLFPGYMKVTGIEEEKKEKEDEKREEGEEETDGLPPLAEGERLDTVDWVEARKETQPPPRFTEATLIKALEENGVGRPSTYASIMSTIFDRKYVEKDKRALKPTTMGFETNDFLVGHLAVLFDVKFTAGMEKRLDEVEEGRLEWTQMLGDFYKDFREWVAAAKGKPADPARVGRLLGLLGQVREWAPERTQGKRTYSDAKFVESVRGQLAETKPISERQEEALINLLGRYHLQIPGGDEAAREMGVEEAVQRGRRSAEPPTPAMRKKIELLAAVTFNAPRKIGKKTYDDREFYDSFRKQVEGGRGLSENQVRFLDRLLERYADQIPDFAAATADLGLGAGEGAGDPHAGALIALVGQVREWRPAREARGRTWDDKAFYDSLSRQFGQRRRLTPKQAAALRKLARGYASQIPDYEAKSIELGLPPPRTPPPADPPAGSTAPA